MAGRDNGGKMPFPDYGIAITGQKTPVRVATGSPTGNSKTSLVSGRKLGR